MRNDFPALDFAAVYQKFVEHHAAKGTESVTLWTLRGWFKRERPEKPAAPKELPTLTCAEGKKGEDVWKIGGKSVSLELLYEVFQEMPDLDEAQAHRYLCEAVGYEWNTAAALRKFNDGWLFSDNEDGTWRGATYATPEELEYSRKVAEENRRIAEEKKAAAEAEAAEKRRKDAEERAETERVRLAEAEAQRLQWEQEDREDAEVIARIMAERAAVKAAKAEKNAVQDS